MGEAICYFWCERARAVRLFRFDGETSGNNQIHCGRRRQTSFPAKMDFRFALPAACFADKCFADVCDFVYFAVAFSNVAFVSEANFYKNLTLV